MKTNNPTKDSIFKRVETKYLLNRSQYEQLRRNLTGYVCEDEYGLSTICNIYYDTENNELIRTSIEKPEYKEKLRIRSYGVPTGADYPVYVELKKKYDGIVYKRRVRLTYAQAQDYLQYRIKPAKNSQILNEIDYFLGFYNPQPSKYIAYDRIATYGRDDPDLRITFDFNLRYRNDNLNLPYGDSNTQLILNDEDVLMEIKVGGAYPLWLSGLLSENGIYPCSFSKFGYAYKKDLNESGNMAASIELNNLYQLYSRRKTC